MPIRFIPAALAVGALALLLAIPRAHAQRNEQRCQPVNSTRSGSGTCETTARLAVSQSRLYTGDGAVDYNTGKGHRHRGLQDSGRV